MKLFFDEDNGTGIPRSIRLLRAPGLTSLQYPGADPRLRWPRGTPDSDWLPWAGTTNHLVISQNTRILETPHEFALIQAHAVRIVFIANGETESWRVFRVIQAKWKWLLEQDRRSGPLIWILKLNGQVEDYAVPRGPRARRRGPV